MLDYEFESFTKNINYNDINPKLGQIIYLSKIKSKKFEIFLKTLIILEFLSLLLLLLMMISRKSLFFPILLFFTPIIILAISLILLIRKSRNISDITRKHTTKEFTFYKTYFKVDDIEKAYNDYEQILFIEEGILLGDFKNPNNFISDFLPLPRSIFEDTEYYHLFHWITNSYNENKALARR